MSFPGYLHFRDFATSGVVDTHARKGHISRCRMRAHIPACAYAQRCHLFCACSLDAEHDVRCAHDTDIMRMKNPCMRSWLPLSVTLMCMWIAVVYIDQRTYSTCGTRLASRQPAAATEVTAAELCHGVTWLIMQLLIPICDACDVSARVCARVCVRGAHTVVVHACA